LARRVAIVGAGPAGTTAAIQARRTDRSSEVCLISKESEPEYSRCGLPYVFSGTVPNLEALISHPPSFYESVSKIRLLLKTECTRLRPDQKTLEITDVQTGDTRELVYDGLVIATGAIPTMPPMRGVNKKGVFVIRTLDDIRALTLHTQACAKSVAIIGAGLIGMEMAEALAKRGFQVTIVEMLQEILPAILDPDMAFFVRQRAERHGIRIIRGATVSEILGANQVEGIVIGNETIRSGTVIVATRVKPDSRLAREAGIETGEAGGILVDERMSTNLHDVYAAGDCVETKCAITGRRFLVQLATAAVRQGLVAGANATGGTETYAPSTGVATTRLFSVEVGCAGLTSDVAEGLGLTPIAARVTGSTRLPYMPDGREVTAKLLCDSRDGRLIGAQVVGEENASWRANFASLAMRAKLTVHEFRRMETCYAPPLAPVWDPLTLAAHALERKLEASRRSR